MKTGSSGSGTRGYTADIKVNEEVSWSRRIAPRNFTPANGGGTGDTDNYLFASKRCYRPFFPVPLASKERPRDDTKIKSRSGQTEGYGRLWCSAVVTPRRIDSVF